jgi:hypothetical protein
VPELEELRQERPVDFLWGMTLASLFNSLGKLTPSI